MHSPEDNSEYPALRLKMVESQLRARGIKDERVLAAMEGVPRHEFAAGVYREQGYEDHPLPLVAGQTISQPYIVALMLEALRLAPGEKVLEVGTGSGYVTALLAEMGTEVVSMERHAVLADSARELLHRLGYSGVRIVAGDGTRGFPEAAPYDAILVSAGTAELPPELFAELREGGRMIIPLGWGDSQQLTSIEKRDGKMHSTLREGCRFVPLIAG